MQPLNLNNSYTSGKIAESITKAYLRLCGYKILATRFTVGKGLGAGEIDIIAQKNKTLVFIEVKKRKTIDIAKESIFQTQMQRIYNSAEIFIAKNPQYNNFDCRFDAVCFNEHYKFQHIKNAWNN